MKLKIALVSVGTIGLAVTPLAMVHAQGAMQVSTGFVSHTLCTAAFVQRLDPRRVYDETVDAMPGGALISWGFNFRIDRQRKAVTATLFGLGETTAAYREGLGCSMVHAGDRIDLSQPTDGFDGSRVRLPEIAGSSLGSTPSRRLARAIETAFAERPNGAVRYTKAIVIIKDGKIVGERYAEGYGPETLLHGYSATKSVTNALIGILVRQGKLAADKPVPLSQWQTPGDPHRRITVDQLLRHTSGLAMGNSLQASIASAFDPVNRMKYIESDMATYAAKAVLEAKPGTAWNYHDGNTILLSRLIRDAAGGRAADVIGFARRELFEPLGMRSAMFEFDATGTPDGSTQLVATAQDWARFGLLYLNDGVVGGQRILPEGWVQYSASPTPDAWVGYGAGFWTNDGDSYGAKFRTALGWPSDSFYASGTFGKFVIIVPSEQLVIVRFGTSGDRGDIEGVSQLVADVIAATGGKPR